MIRNRKVNFLLIVITTLIGLASRKYPVFFGYFFAEYLGDTLWALLIYWIFGWIFKTKSIFKIVLYALFFSCFIEISQLYHATWIDGIRATRLGALLLGHGFLWTDIVCYTVGIFLGATGEYYLLKRSETD